MRSKIILAVLGLLLVLAGNGRAADGPAINYTRDIKPILAAHCYACHGPDEGRRKAKLRLDVRDVAIKKAIKPGDAANSSMIERVSSDNPEEVMPPPSSKKGALMTEQIALLKRWIEQVRKFDIHWAYVKPVRPTPPAVKNTSWPCNPIDRFIAARHDKLEYQPSPETDRVTLLRRLNFDLIGLPPSPEEVEAFVNDKSDNAYEKVVDRLLGSPHFGERMAVYWLDLVRYADTGGYHSDNHRDIALYRDWVIAAFNQNKRFDRFTIEQLAGDLLPKPTAEQKIASGYNRLLQTTEEGGAQAKEYTAKYAADRVRNVSSVWLATTLGCCECHDHKFDPFTTKDFYSFGAFFADVKEVAVGRQEQVAMPTAEQQAQLERLDKEIAALRPKLNKPTAAAEQAAARADRQAGRAEEAAPPDDPEDARNDVGQSACHARSAARQLARRLGTDRGAGGAGFAAIAGIARAAHSTRPGALARVAGQSAYGARVCQSPVEADFRPGHRQEPRRLRHARRLPDASPTARLAGRRVH